MRRMRELPPRPALPAMLGCALSLWGSCAAALGFVEQWDARACALLGAFGVVASVACGALLWRFEATQLWAAVLGAMLGLACAGGCAAWMHQVQEQGEGLAGRWRFEVRADGSSGLYGPTCFARTTLPGLGAVDVRLRFDRDEEVPRYGDVFEADASFGVPGGSSASYCWRQGVVLEGSARDVERFVRSDALGVLLGFRNRTIDALGEAGEGDGAAVLAALVCGWRGGLDGTGAYDAYKAAGLAHLVAVSGAHLSIVAGFAAALLRVLRIPRRASLALQAALVLCYLALAAAPPSAVRAAVMTFAGMLSFAARRRPAAANALAACMIGCIALAPTTALSASFALSALSTLGIVLFAGLCSAWIERLCPPAPGLARDALALTCASSIAATPLSAALFSQLPLVAPLANVLAAPFFPLVCTGGLVAAICGLAVPAVSAAVLGLASGAAAALTALVRLIADVPYASVPVDVPLEAALAASAVVSAALWLLWPPPRARVAAALAAAACCAALCAIFVAPRFAGEEIVMLDVGQGDAFVIRSRGAAVLVDTGNQERLLREALARHGVFRLDAVVVTHGDDDHMGALASLAGVVEVDSVLVADDALSCGCASCENLVSSARALVGDDRVAGLRVGDELRVGGFDLDVVWPERFSEEGGNADSVCLVAEADANGDGEADWRSLFVGDVERDQLRTLIDGGAVGPVDIYKVGHHGSRNALDDEEAAALEPRIALVSVGARNRYGHPTEETLERLEDAGARIYRTDKQGDVSCKLKDDRIEVSTLR